VPSPSSDEQPGKFSLNRILEGKARKQAARMFFETTVIFRTADVLIGYAIAILLQLLVVSP